MKYITILTVFIALALVSCNDKKLNDYVSLSGKFENLSKNDTVLHVNSKGYRKIISIDTNGAFSDTLHIKEPNFFSISLNRNTRFTGYYNIGDELFLEGDASDLNNTLRYKGRGQETNNYLIARVKEVNQFNKSRKGLYSLDSVAFYEKVNGFNDKIESILSNKKIDSVVYQQEKKALNGFVKNVKSSYIEKHESLLKFAKGKSSPKFTNYENFKGGKTSLDDLKGKYVYIDIWATWCRPCLGEIPALKELEKEYRGKNVQFVSISTDKLDKHETWKNMIIEKGMSGIQLFAGDDNSFMRDYQVKTIPRFIFIDPNGNIVSAEAPRPSQKEEITSLFKEVGL